MVAVILVPMIRQRERANRKRSEAVVDYHCPGVRTKVIREIPVAAKMEICLETGGNGVLTVEVGPSELFAVKVAIEAIGISVAYGDIDSTRGTQSVLGHR